MADAPGPRRMPAQAGWAWLARSLWLLRAQPGRLLLLAVLLQFVLGLTRVPLLGLLVIIAVPALSAGLLEAMHQLAAGARPLPTTLFLPFGTSPRTGRLLALGAVLFAVTLLCVSAMLSPVIAALEPDVLARIEQGDIEAVALLGAEQINRIVLALAVAVGLSGTLSFFAIPSIWFGGYTVLGALVAGVKAMLVNWRPLLVLSLGLTLLALPAALLVGVMYGLASEPGGLSFLYLGVMMLTLLLFQLIVFGTQYWSYRDIFPAGAAHSATPAPPEDGSQLVA